MVELTICLKRDISIRNFNKIVKYVNCQEPRIGEETMKLSGYSGSKPFGRNEIENYSDVVVLIQFDENYKPEHKERIRDATKGLIDLLLKNQMV